jgi:hypothetical protein
MQSLVITIGILALMLWLQPPYPLIAAGLAVLPIKTISAVSMAWERGGKDSALLTLQAIACWQVLWLCVAVVLYAYWVMA